MVETYSNSITCSRFSDIKKYLKTTAWFHDLSLDFSVNGIINLIIIYTVSGSERNIDNFKREINEVIG